MSNLTRTQQIEFLQEIQTDVDEFISQLDPKEIGGAVNWGDIGCASAAHCLYQDGTEGYKISLEEASPDGCEALRNAIYNFLIERYNIQEFEIYTEW